MKLQSWQIVKGSFGLGIVLEGKVLYRASKDNTTSVRGWSLTEEFEDSSNWGIAGNKIINEIYDAGLFGGMDAFISGDISPLERIWERADQRTKVYNIYGELIGYMTKEKVWDA